MKSGEHKFNFYFFAPMLFLFLFFFLLGVTFGVLRIYPSSTIFDGCRAILAFKILFGNKLNAKFDTDLWYPVRKEYIGAKGVTLHKPGLTYKGYTLYTSGHDQVVILIDMTGSIVHEWHVPFDTIWESEWKHNSPPKSDRIYIRDAYLYPNGDMLLLYVADQHSPWGLLLAKANKNSRVIWKYANNVHHDITVGPGGEIFTLSHRITEDVPQKMAYLPTPIFEDSIVKLDPNGHVLKEISVIKSFANSEFRGFLKTNSFPYHGDIFHTNNIDLVTQEVHQKFPFTRVGQLLLCFRNLNSLALIDPLSEKVDWVMTGPWNMPHDPDFLDNGNMMIFDNWWGDSMLSRVVEFDPLTQEIVWQYQGDSSKPLYSRLRSRQQVLPNGNVLICESGSGRLVEVNREGKIVWEFVNPIREHYKGQHYIPVVSTGRRYSISELQFLNE